MDFVQTPPQCEPPVIGMYTDDSGTPVYVQVINHHDPSERPDVHRKKVPWDSFPINEVEKVKEFSWVYFNYYPDQPVDTFNVFTVYTHKFKFRMKQAFNSLAAFLVKCLIVQARLEYNRETIGVRMCDGVPIVSFHSFVPVPDSLSPMPSSQAYTCVRALLMAHEQSGLGITENAFGFAYTQINPRAKPEFFAAAAMLSLVLMGSRASESVMIGNPVDPLTNDPLGTISNTLFSQFLFIFATFTEAKELKSKTTQRYGSGFAWNTSPAIEILMLGNLVLWDVAGAILETFPEQAFQSKPRHKEQLLMIRRTLESNEYKKYMDDYKDGKAHVNLYMLFPEDPYMDKISTKDIEELVTSNPELLASESVGNPSPDFLDDFFDSELVQENGLYSPASADSYVNEESQDSGLSVEDGDRSWLDDLFSEQ